MKKLLILLAVMAITTNIDAKIRFGAKGGFNFASLSGADFSNSLSGSYFSNRTGWHAGAVLNIGLPLGIAIQPELLYNSKGADENAIGYIEIPVDLQWGIKLPMVRPYVSLTPYISYAVNSSLPIERLQNWDGGIGVGVGLDFWKLQVSLKYFWGFGNVLNYMSSDVEFDLPSVQNRNLMLSLGFFL